MSDTTPEAARWLRERYARRTPLERLEMATGMFEDVKAIVRARLISEHRRLAPTEVRVGMIRHLYTHDLAPADLEAVVGRLRAMYGEESGTSLTA